MPTEVVIYTDGGCGRGDKAGGWAAVLLFEKDGELHSMEISGASPDTTNNRMEITGVLEGLRTLKRPCHVTVYSDSQYVVNAIGSFVRGRPKWGASGWMNDWKRRGWVRKEGELKNPDLWKLIDEEIARHLSVTLAWVRGHSGHEYNERCDVLCTEAIARLRNENTAAGDGLQASPDDNSSDGDGATTSGVCESIRLSGPRIN